MSTNVQAKELNYNTYETKKYDDDIIRSIPGHEKLHQTILAELETISLPKHAKILDLGVGTALTSEALLSLFPKAKLVGIDFSKHMLEGAKQRLKAYNTEFIQGDYSKVPIGRSYDIVTSVIGLHHQGTDKAKKKMFAKIYSSLKSGGIFIFGDLVTHQDEQIAALNEALHFHYLVENAADKKSLQEWAHHHRNLNALAPVEDQMKWLKELGFSSVELKFLQHNTALIIAKK